MKVAVAQLGARMHYAVPRILHEVGMLHRLYTDICAVKDWPRWLRIVTPESWQTGGLARLLGRVPEGVPRERITAFTNFGAQYFWRRTRASSPSEITAAHLWAGWAFGERVVAEGMKTVNAVYTFNSAGLEILQHARQHGIRGIVEQTIAPRGYRELLMQEEHALHPEWETRVHDAHSGEFIEREYAEWEHADVVLCGSSFVRDSIAACDGSVEKCMVVPYGVDTRFSVPERLMHDGPLRVLTVGAVGLRKGSPYVLKAAQRCGDHATFRMVGPVGVSDKARAALNEYVELVGHVPRGAMPQQYAWADVFLLPSICEGSATVTYEALAAGLPVICTPNTGSIVRDGEEGFIVSIRDADAITERIHQLVDDLDLRQGMGVKAKQRYEQAGSLTAYGKRLLRVVQNDARVHE